MLRRLLPLCLAFSAGCTWFHNDPYVLITSEPLGARIALDGQDTGRTTPTRLELSGYYGDDHLIELTMPGYAPERRILVQHTEHYTSKWIDGAFENVLPPLPLFWTGGDFVFPFGVRAAIVPGELHCRLRPAGAAPLGYDALAAGSGSTPFEPK
ncbi:MAG: hypothetical protein RL398_2327 [Planctomycetota bacterium]|jgi:hypothetical protein